MSRKTNKQNLNRYQLIILLLTGGFLLIILVGIYHKPTLQKIFSVTDDISSYLSKDQSQKTYETRASENFSQEMLIDPETLTPNITTNKIND